MAQNNLLDGASDRVQTFDGEVADAVEGPLGGKAENSRPLIDRCDIRRAIAPKRLMRLATTEEPENDTHVEYSTDRKASKSKDFVLTKSRDSEGTQHAKMVAK